MKRSLNLIVAVDLASCIGRSGPVPLVWKQKEDMKRFKKLTTGNTVIMGYNTFLSIGKPLPKRANIVVSSRHFDELSKRDDLLVAKSLEDAIAMGEIIGEELFLIGGGMLYNEAIKKDLVKNYRITIFEARLPNHEDSAYIEFPVFSEEWKKENVGGANIDENNEFYSVFADIRSV
jgi:dihydrofolate reductase